MKIRDFLVAIPELCSASNPERWGWLNGAQFDEELKNPDSVFARNDIDDIVPENRLQTAFGFDGDARVKRYCQNLTELMLLSHYHNAHDEHRYDVRRERLIESLSAAEPEFPDVAALMTVKEAAALAGWNI